MPVACTGVPTATAMRVFGAVAVCLLSSVVSGCPAGQSYDTSTHACRHFPWLSATAGPPASRARMVLAEMTLDEKLTLLVRSLTVCPALLTGPQTSPGTVRRARCCDCQAILC